MFSLPLNDINKKIQGTAWLKHMFYQEEMKFPVLFKELFKCDILLSRKDTNELLSWYGLGLLPD